MGIGGFGYAGDGDDWGGDNPHYDSGLNADPTSTGYGSNASSSSSDGGSYGGSGDSTGSSSYDPNYWGGDPDDYWGPGNNPHYQPWTGANQSPMAPVSSLTKLALTSRIRSTYGPRVQITSK
jgi:hypothetical protein